MSASTTAKIYVNQVSCAGCGLCMESCPRGAISIRSGVAVIDNNTCNGCGNCVGACPSRAIARYVPMTRENLADMIGSLKKNADALIERIEKLRTGKPG